MILTTQLDERTKKLLLVLCALFIILLLIFGTIYLIITKYMEKESKKMDEYMYDLVRYKLVTNTKQFQKALFYQERRMYYNQSKWGYRILIGLTVLAFALTFVFFEAQYAMFFTKAFDIIPIIKWPTIKETNEILSQIEGSVLLTGPDWMPASLIPTFVTKNPNFSDPMLYCSLMYYVCSIMSFFAITKAILGHIARIRRGKKMAIEVFEKNLDKINIYSYSQSINSPIPVHSEYDPMERNLERDI